MRILALLLLGASLLTACSSARTKPCPGGQPPAASDLAGYRLGSEDRIRVTIFRQPELSGQFALDGQGSVALPLVGNVQASGLTTRELEDEIERRLQSEHYLVNPQVGVEPLVYRPFYVLGEVNRPGSYEYRSDINVVSAVALAGGYTYRAKTSSASIERGGCSFPAKVDTVVLPGDIVTIPERYF
jgi:protein involved in polysaccharide export with SLBB domain